ncbi:MAG: hypothetical protein JNK78_15470 [Planctomycetes bacterium]|nr:hypothetical protein [Planctomycetota bacterium]
MTTDDPELLRALADADAAHPVGPGAEFSPERLAQAVARQARRRFAGAALLSALAAAFVFWPRTDVDEGVAALAADIARVQRLLADWRDADVGRLAAEEQDRRARIAAIELRCELAFARTAPLSSLTAPEEPR